MFAHYRLTSRANSYYDYMYIYIEFVCLKRATGKLHRRSE